MTHLTRYENSGIELVINTQTGEAFSSIRGYARMSGKAESTIRERCNGARKNEIKEAQIDTVGGLQKSRLISISIVLKWLEQDKLYDVVAKLLNVLTNLKINIPENSFTTKEKISKKNISGYIYIFGTVCEEKEIYTVGSKFVKVGFSTNPIKRFKTIDEVVPTPMVIVDVLKSCTLVEEINFHRKFADQKIKGEWYSSSICKEFSNYFSEKTSVIDRDIYLPYRKYNLENPHPESLCDVFGVYG